MENKNRTEDSANGDLPADFDALLVQYAHCSVPDDFVAEALSRFDVVSETAVARRSWLTLGVAIGAILLLSGSLAWLALFNLTFISKAAAALSRLGLLTLKYIFEMWHQMPELGTGILLCLWTIMFVCTVMLIKAFREATVQHTSVG